MNETKRSIKRSEPLIQDDGMIQLPTDVLSQILSPYQCNEQSCFVSLVCKRWHGLISKDTIRITRSRILTFYAQNGTLASLKLIRSIFNNDKKFFCFELISNCSQKQMLEWVFQELQTIERKDAMVDYLTRAAASLGMLELLKSLQQLGWIPQKNSINYYAAEGGHLEVIKWAKSQNYQFDSYTFSSAAKTGNLDLLKWLKLNACPWDGETCSNAARNGHLEALIWLRENQCPWNTFTSGYAAEGNHIDVVRWVLANGCPVDEKTTCSAARNGNIEMLKLAREYGCDWNSYICAAAAEGGHLEVLKWLRANGCPWNRYTTGRAYENGHTEVVKWAVENGCLGPYSDDECEFE